jgi:hypothetical protein
METPRDDLAAALDPSSLPAVLGMMKEQSARLGKAAAAEAIAQIGMPAVPALAQALVDADPEVRDLAGLALLKIEARSAEPLPAEVLLRPLARIAPAVWPGRFLPLQPGDLTQFFTNRGGGEDFHPFRGAPASQPAGGIVYLPAELAREDFFTLLRLLGVADAERTDYAVFAAASPEPQRDHYLVQLRTISPGVLDTWFGIRPKASDPSLLFQDRPLAEMLWAFIGHQQAVWGTFFADPRAPAGALGGDPGKAREELAFGFMVEGPGIYRIWSRAWLVGK